MQYSNWARAGMIITALLLSIAITGCSDNDPVTPQVGTITIDPEPNSLDAHWLLSGPNNFSLESSGDATLAGMAVGGYTLTWGALTGWTSPNTVSQTLEANGTLTFMGTYMIQTGTITIDPEPNDINAPWQISGPNGFNQSGSGDETFEYMITGEYTLIWGAASGCTMPNPIAVTQPLTAGETVTFSGVYIDNFPFPDTTAKLMANFRNAYDEMNIEEYRRSLHTGFIFVFADGSPVAPTTGIYTLEEDLQSTTRMFNGLQGQDQDGHPRPGVRDIEFTELLRLTDWEEVPESDIYFPGSLRALFNVRVVFYLNTIGVNNITVDSQQLFYLKSVSEEQDDGSTRQHFYMIGQQDLDSSLVGNEDMSWGTVKTLYR